ncbi:LuxR C-terminal-related transcriptional regulator [Georgenia muralis]
MSRSEAVPDPLVATVHLIGRDDALDDLTALLDRPDVRWVSVTGRSGIGKSAVVDALVARLRQRGTVTLAEALLDDREAPLEDQVRNRLGALRRWMGDAAPSPPAVVVLDDLDPERRAEADDVVALLEPLTWVTVLATSVTGLHRPWEVRYPLAGLAHHPAGETAAPDDDGAATLPTPAAALFLAHAARVDARFRAGQGVLRDVERLCSLLAGVPRDLEVCAARTPVLGVGGVLRELTGHSGAGRRAVLSWRDADGRPLASSLEWTYARLSADARLTLRAASVFTDTFGLDHLRAVAAPGLDDGRLMDALTELVDVSLAELVGVTRDGRSSTEPDPEPWFRLRALVRDHAAREARGEKEELWGRHAAYLGEVARACASRWDDAQEAEGLRGLTPLLADVFAAVDRHTSRGETTAALRLACDAAPVALRQGHHGEVQRVLRRLLDEPGTADVDEATRGDALVWLAAGALGVVDTGEGLPMVLRTWGEGAELIRRYGAPTAMLRTLAVVSLALPVTRDVELTARCLAEGTALADRIGHRVWADRFRLWTGMQRHVLGDLDAAWTTGLAVMESARLSGDPVARIGAALLLIPLQGARTVDAHLAPSPSDLLELATALGDPFYLSLARGFAARDALDRGDTVAACRWVADALRDVDEPRRWRLSEFMVALVVGVAVARGDRLEAATLHGAARAPLAASTGWPPMWRRSYEETVAALEAGLAGDVWTRCLHDGAALGWAEVLTRAAAYVQGVLRSETATVASAARAMDELTARERQVLGQIVAGLTNREIAERLQLSAKTVMHHSTAIYRKLGVRGRAEAAVWSVRHEQG